MKTEDIIFEECFLELVYRYPSLLPIRQEFYQLYMHIRTSFENGGRLYICGNGGSASDSLHIVGELVKAFTLKRSLEPKFKAIADNDLLENLEGGLPAFQLVSNTALTTAFANDVSSDFIFAQQVYVYAKENDCILGISTSGNSVNVLNALRVAKLKGCKALSLTGKDGGKMKAFSDVCLIAPGSMTHEIQELHLPIYHCLCIMLERYFWPRE